jgi:hypothetical protein
VTLPAGFPAPSKHVFSQDEYGSADCTVCGFPVGFGALHAIAGPLPALADPPVDPGPAGASDDLYGSPTDPARCECGISIDASIRGGWRTPGCHDCTHRLRRKVSGG